jgi:hypothetical protein
VSPLYETSVLLVESKQCYFPAEDEVYRSRDVLPLRSVRGLLC